MAGDVTRGTLGEQPSLFGQSVERSDEPVKNQAPTRELPEFPVNALPSWIGEMVVATAESIQVPVDLPGCIALGLVSRISSQRSILRMNPEWTEQLNLLLTIGMGTGTGKSSAYRAMLAPLEDWVEGAQSKWKDENARLRQREKNLRKRMLELEKGAASGDATCAAEAEKTAVELSKMPSLSLPQLYSSDVTPEGIVRQLSEQNGLCGLFSSEGGEVFSNLTGRYSKGLPNYDVLLKGYSGDTIRVDRADSKRDPITIRNPSISGVLCVQPCVVRDVVSSTKLRDRGLIGRFQWVMPPNLVGSRKIVVANVPDHVKQNYEINVTRLLDLACSKPGQEKHSIHLSHEASDMLTDFRIHLEPKLKDDGVYGRMTDWACRLGTLIAKLAGGLHTADEETLLEPWIKPISAESMNKAIQLAQYFLAHASRIYDLYAVSPSEDLRDRVSRRILLEGKDEFATRDVYRVLGIPSDQAKSVLNELCEDGLISRIDCTDEPRSRSGRKNRNLWKVNSKMKEESVNYGNCVAGGSTNETR